VKNMTHPIVNKFAASRTDSARYSDPDDGKIDIEPFMARALNDVIETIMLFGVYPQPRRSFRNGCYRNLAGVRFDLSDWLFEHYADELPGLAAGFLTLNGDEAYEHKSRHEKRVIELIAEELRESEIVRDKALEMAEEERNEGR